MAKTTPHIYWLHGFAGCGKSSISLEVAKIYAGSGRLLANYFFFRGAGDRSTMNRFAVTIASQLVTAIPGTAPLIEAAVRAEPGVVTGEVALATQLDLLILHPFQTVLSTGALGETLAKGPFFIVVDGLDECEDKQGVEEFIDHMLAFFKQHPSIPLRLFIASRVEQHIRERLEIGGVQLGNLDNHSPDHDIEKYLHVSFQRAAKRDHVIRAYVKAHGQWPVKSDLNELIKHIGGSFVLASTIFKFIIQPATKADPWTPMERLPLTLKMNGLDGLYAQTLARSQHLPHFHNIISTIALLKEPLTIVEIANLLGIQTFEVVHVLLNLQAIIHVPGTDDQGRVTLCHTSLHDFLTTERRSGIFFVPRSFHLYLSYHCFSSIFDTGANAKGPLLHYGQGHYIGHWKACDEPIDEIEQSKANQSLFVGRMSSHAFLCTLLWYSLMLDASELGDPSLLDLLTKCAQHFALAVECPDTRRTRRWLEMKTWSVPMNIYTGMRKSRFTEQTHKAVKLASTTIHTKVRLVEHLAYIVVGLKTVNTCIVS
jgi:hypothetical protein